MDSLPVAAALIHRLELVLGGAADRADPFRGDFIKRGVGGDMVVRITLWPGHKCNHRSGTGIVS